MALFGNKLDKPASNNSHNDVQGAGGNGNDGNHSQNNNIPLINTGNVNSDNTTTPIYTSGSHNLNGSMNNSNSETNFGNNLATDMSTPNYTQPNLNSNNTSIRTTGPEVTTNSNVNTFTPLPAVTNNLDTHTNNFSGTTNFNDGNDNYTVNTPPATNTLNTASNTLQGSPTGTYETPSIKASPAGPGQNTGYPWKQTQRNLLELQQQEQQIKDQLKQELLDQRSFLKHDLRQQGLTLINSTTKTGDPAQKIQGQIDEVNQGLVKWFGTQKIANHVFFNKKRTYYLIDDNLNPDSTQLQTTLLGRLRVLFDGLQIPLSHISTDYNDQLNADINQLCQDHLLTNNARVINKYQDLQEFNKSLSSRKKIDMPLDASMSTVHDEDNNADKVYDQNQQLVMVIYYQDGNQIHVIEHYRDNTVLSRDIFDRSGAISATQYFDQANSKRVIRENFYRTDGSLVLIKSYQDNEPYIQLLSRSNVLISVFNSELELTLWWLENHVFNSDTTILVTTDSPLYQPLLAAQNLSVELIPILNNYENSTEVVDQLMNEKTPIDSLLVTQSDAKTYIEKNTQHDVDISVLPDNTDSNTTQNRASAPRF